MTKILFISVLITLTTVPAFSVSKKYRVYLLGGKNTCLPDKLGAGNKIVRPNTFPDLNSCQSFMKKNGLSPKKEKHVGNKYEKNCLAKIKELKFIAPTKEHEVYERKPMGEYTISYIKVKEFKKDKDGLKRLIRTRRYSCMHGKGINRNLLLLK